MTEPNAPQDPPFDEQPGGYAPPPQPPEPGYGAPPANQPAYSQPPGAAAAPFSPLVGRQLTSDETMWSMLGHLGGIILGFIAPLIVMLTKGNESPYTKYHSTEALNFQITIAIGYVISAVLTFVLIGVFTWFLVWVASIIFSIIAGLAANKGETYKYPFALRLVK
ncbi:MAG: DUF4870 domain-containing protein [Pseudonocardiales bacterium]